MPKNHEGKQFEEAKGDVSVSAEDEGKTELFVKNIS